MALRLASFAAILSYEERPALFADFRIPSLTRLLVESPIDVLLNLHGMVFSWNKGWMVFAPLALAGLVAAALRRADEELADVRLFAWGSFLSLAVGFAALSIWSEETWGPRYLQAAVAPACLALALAARREALPLARRC